MGILEDISRFLETRLEEFVRANPQIELQILEEQLRSQEIEITRLLTELTHQEQKLQAQILAIGEDIKLWHGRVTKAAAANRADLLAAAQEREAALLRQGNQVWAQMKLIKDKVKQAKELQAQIQERLQEIKIEITKKQSTTNPSSWSSASWQNLTPPPQGNDPLEQQFRDWEMDEELENLKQRVKGRK
ncbi:MAG: TIGR04376 family protein [Pseudanabaenaceae cyanobacterium bins.68]|nr:TIGR04376 family protein [Pseudanabaenaceae cyanobacterium bins.68]